MQTWIKLYCELLGDPQFLAMNEPLQARWMKLLLLRGMGDLRKLKDHEIAIGLGIRMSELRSTYDVFVAKGWITDDWDIPKWDARQGPIDPGAAERMRRHRRNVARHATANGPVTSRPPARESRSEGEEKSSETARAPAVTPPVTDPDPTDPENLERPCGRGLWLMRHYMNEVSFSERGNSVRMSKLLRNGQA